MEFKVLLTDYAWPDLNIEREILEAAGGQLMVAETTDPATLAKQATDVDAIMTNWARVPESVIAASPKLRIISRLGVGLDNIDVESATQRGILVTNVPDYCLVEVAEHAIAMLFALARNVAWHHHESKCGRYDLQTGPQISRIEGQTLGIVGLGNIGELVAKKGACLGLSVLATSRTGRDAPAGTRICELDELLAASDYVSLHLPLTSETHHILGALQLARMKSTAFLINTARGGLVDPSALADALAENRIAGAALDVQEPEPPDLTQPPYNDPRVIVTPHVAFVSRQSLADLRSRVAHQVVDCLWGRHPENVVNDKELD